jgi:hypothetical protein
MTLMSARPFVFGMAMALCVDGSGCARLRSWRDDRGAPPVAERDRSPHSRQAMTPAAPVLARESVPPPVEPVADVAPRPAERPKVAAPTAATDPLSEIRSLLARARANVDKLENYQVDAIRQELVGAALQPREHVILSIRRAPKAVRLEWPDGPHQGREVLYNEGGPMHVRMPGALIPRTSLAPDSPLVRRSSRHPITEAGFDSIVERMESALAQAGTAGALTYSGQEPIGDARRTCHKIVQVTPTGETWRVHLDVQTLLPVRVEATAANGELLELYEFGAVRADLPELAGAAAFDPDARWGPSRGLLGGLGRASDRTGQAGGASAP